MMLGQITLAEATIGRVCPAKSVHLLSLLLPLSGLEKEKGVRTGSVEDRGVILLQGIGKDWHLAV